MEDLNFCPLCDAPQHKILHCKDNLYFCKSCNKFYHYQLVDVKCSRCDGKLQKSDFDSPQGGAVFHCQKCKKTFPAAEILEDIK